jgi:hypothetical protein
LLPDATGPFLSLRGALRWRSADLDGAGSGDALDRGALVSLTLSWHHLIAAHLVDAGDGALRAARE